jgi:hypothetical protein
VVWQAPGAGAGLALAGSSLGRGSVVIDTDFVVLPAQSEAPAVQPNTTCVGIVWQPSEESEAQEQEQEQAARASRRRGKHPRRTQALRFTCNLCGEVNDAAVNPHAWRKGSVFARCQVRRSPSNAAQPAAETLALECTRAAGPAGKWGPC